MLSVPKMNSELVVYERGTIEYYQIRGSAIPICLIINNSPRIRYIVPEGYNNPKREHIAITPDR